MTVVTVIYHTHQNVYTKKIGHIFCIYVLTSMRTDIERIIINVIDKITCGKGIYYLLKLPHTQSVGER